MKPFFTVSVLALGALASGCGAQDSTTTTTTTAVSSETTPVAATQTQTVATTAPASTPVASSTVAKSVVTTKSPYTTTRREARSDGNPYNPDENHSQKVQTSTKSAAPDTRYRVADKNLGPGAPAALLTAIKNATVPCRPKNSWCPPKRAWFCKLRAGQSRSNSMGKRRRFT
jgi:hypothetical protein